MVSGAADFADFIKKTANTVWQDVSRADQIHSDELDKEIAVLGSLAKKGLGQSYAKRLAQICWTCGRVGAWSRAAT